MNAQVFVIGKREYIAQEVSEPIKRALREWVASLSDDEREEIEQLEAEPDPAW